MVLCFGIPKERSRDGFLLENGSRLLEELIASCDGKSNPIRIFSEEELKKATNNYDQCLHATCIYNLYKGNHEDRIILVKKFDCTSRNHLRVKEIINEIAILSQINHKNVVKLLGCCLETKLPIGVYEFCFNGTLSQHIRAHGGYKPHLSWESRLRIATEIADAVMYLHTGMSKSTIHRDLHSQTIWLDQQNIAKLSDLSLSIPIPFGEKHASDSKIVGTTGHIDHVYLKTGRVSEKTDVYSLGMVLLELLTGQKNVYRDGEYIPLLEHVNILARDNRFSEIVAPTIWEEGGNGMDLQLQAFCELAMRCTKQREEERPTMMEVAKELRQIKRLKCERTPTTPYRWEIIRASALARTVVGDPQVHTQEDLK